MIKKPSVTLAVDNSDKQDPLNFHNNPIVIFMGAAVMVGGMLLVLAGIAATQHARGIEQLYWWERTR